MKDDFFKKLCGQMSDDQVRSAGRLIEKWFSPSEHIYRGPPEPQYGKMPESKYDRDNRFKQSGCVEIGKLQPGCQYVLIEGDSKGAIVTYIGPTTPSDLLMSSKKRHLFLKPDSAELIFNGFDFEQHLPMIPLHKIPSLEGDGT